ncbi:MAG: serine dehydratase [Gammaproteobacteria bacterium (ex Lamellibrachia satsuma)]|nr:MAG: L-serine ammonia-lyase [Gammaproteobacteria bacterium (ex Lamellibrachia satsuma)]RRS32518.1 MAG: serine dehydratase [Gammaproteobacteria bacterium (ex Lamellibrachia satsuma)]RRS36709.1 MAG: serine dehydratase [Gammaproteobacteria bacterium (ex Lamellibrachia satsuma)]
MFISVLDLFKIGIGPSSSHTLGPMVAAYDFIERIKDKKVIKPSIKEVLIRCTLKGSLAFTGKGHSTDRAVALGLHGYLPTMLTDKDVASLIKQIWESDRIQIDKNISIIFKPTEHIVFDKEESLPEHPNGMVFELKDQDNKILSSETYFSIGGGFISTLAEVNQLQAPLKMEPSASCTYPFDSANAMLTMAKENNISISQMKLVNEMDHLTEKTLHEGMDRIWQSMQTCIEKGMKAKGTLPGDLGILRRAKGLQDDLNNNPQSANINDWLCAYAMAVNEENAAGNMVVTAPTNGAAGVIPAVIYYFVTHEHGTIEQVHEFLLTASAIGGLIKHRSSISGAEVGCQGEVGSAAAMAAAGLCSVLGGTPQQVENAAEIALEHHLGMTCDPVNGLVQVPCIERNGFGAIKAYTAASLALRGDGSHFMPLDNCIAAMKQTGLEMSHKYKETSLGGLAVSITEC